VIESDEEQGRDLSRLVVARAGRLVATGDAHEPYRVVGPGGEVVEPVSVFLRDLLASGKSESTLRSYSVDLLRWWRFLDAVDVQWDRASRAEARDFSCWIQLTAKQRLQTSRPKRARLSSRAAGAPNAVTGKPTPGDGYAPSTVAHSETVLRKFYDFHRDGGTGPVLNPFPLDSSRRGRRHAHHNPLDEWAPERSGRYRPSVPKRIPRAIPDEWFNRLFASLPFTRLLIDSGRTANLGIDGLNGVVGGISDSGSHVEYAVMVGGKSYMIDSVDLIPTGEVLKREAFYDGGSARVDPQQYTDDE
jgi:hypothetical protein